jgi:hypothetical protein
MGLAGLVGLSVMLAPIAGAPASADGATKGGPTRAQTSAALALFQRDWVLMNWALRFFDSDGDIALSPKEAAAAAAAFRKLADVDRDGRITPTEYRIARQYIMTRS